MDEPQPVQRDVSTVPQRLISAIHSVAPGLVPGGKVDLERFRELVGDNTIEEDERYEFTWTGRRASLELLRRPGIGSLVPDQEASVCFDTADHVFVEGDNLEVLRLMGRAYEGRVKMIYIDPPYNTGADVLYVDRFADSLENYLKLSGQADLTGALLTSNPETSGRFHSAWLSMMLPRLYLANRLLRDDGVIFVSINDVEMARLRLLLNESFGEENFVTAFVWQSKKGGGSDAGSAVTDHEYVLCYAKRLSADSLSSITIEAEELDQSDEHGSYRRGRELNKWGAGSRREDRPTMWFPIPGPEAVDVYPMRNDGEEGRWRKGKPAMMKLATAGNIDFVPREDGTFIAYEKIRSSDPRSKPFRSLLQGVGTTADGTKAIKRLFDNKVVFDFPKPVALLRRLLEMGITSDDDIVLDFFAGSCTTAEAVIEHNDENDSAVRVICVQVPEPTPQKSEARKQGFETISALGRERIRRVLERSESKQGLRAFRLSASNFELWDAPTGATPDEYLELLNSRVEPLRADYAQESLEWEVILKEGLPLDSRISERSLDGEAALIVDDPDTSQSMWLALGEAIGPALTEAVMSESPTTLVCRDCALTDTGLANIAARVNVRTI